MMSGDVRTMTIADALREVAGCVDSKLCVKCDVSLLPGQLPLWTSLDMAWVRLVGAYPSTRFPQQRIDSDSCAAPLAYQIEIGIIHCVPTVGNRGQAPMAEALENLAVQILQDMEDIKMALRCCLPGWDILLNTWTPIGPTGNVVGGSWQATIAREYGDG
jgi:hypothetical protein